MNWIISIYLPRISTYPSFAWSDELTDVNLTRLTWLIILKISSALLLMDPALFETPAALLLMAAAFDATSLEILKMSASLLLMAAALFEIPAALLLMAAALFETSVTMLLMAAS